MKDIQGTELKIGDKVFSLENTNHYFISGEITGFTTFYAKILATHYANEEMIKINKRFNLRRTSSGVLLNWRELPKDDERWNQ